MCSLFGLIDYQNALTTRQKNRILQVLAKECEVRGTDATGIAYNFGGSIKVFKRPLAAHKLKFHVPNGVHVIMGHTRLATQGRPADNFNNHPWSTGALLHLAHNGVLWNDKELRQTAEAAGYSDSDRQLCGGAAARTTENPGLHDHQRDGGENPGLFCVYQSSTGTTTCTLSAATTRSRSSTSAAFTCMPPPKKFCGGRCASCACITGKQSTPRRAIS